MKHSAFGIHLLLPLIYFFTRTGMVKVILQMKPEHSGKFWNYNGNELPW